MRNRMLCFFTPNELTPDIGSGILLFMKNGDVFSGLYGSNLCTNLHGERSFQVGYFDPKENRVINEKEISYWTYKPIVP